MILGLEMYTIFSQLLVLWYLITTVYIRVANIGKTNKIAMLPSSLAYENKCDCGLGVVANCGAEVLSA